MDISFSIKKDGMLNNFIDDTNQLMNGEVLVRRMIISWASFLTPSRKRAILSWIRMLAQVISSISFFPFLVAEICLRYHSMCLLRTCSLLHQSHSSCLRYHSMCLLRTYSLLHQSHSSCLRILEDLPTLCRGAFSGSTS